MEERWIAYAGIILMWALFTLFAIFMKEYNVKNMETTSQLPSTTKTHVMKDEEVYQVEVLRNAQGEVLEIVYSEQK